MMIQNKNFFLKIILTFCLIYISQDSLLFGTNDNDQFILIGKYISILLLIPIFSIYLFKKGKKEIELPIIILCLSLLITCLVNDTKYNVYIMLFSIILLAYLISKLISLMEFKIIYTSIIYFLSTISAIFILVSILFPSILNYLPTIYNFNGYKYKFYIFGSIMEYKGIANISNLLIFREPGVAGIFIILSLYFELFTENKINIKRVIILMVNLFLTFSTTAYIILFLLIFCFITLKNVKYNTRVKRKLILFLVILIPIFLMNASIIFDKVFDKLINRNNDSFASRYASFIINFRFFLKKPLFGVGEYYLADNYSLYAYKYYKLNASANTNSFLSCFSCFGVTFGFLCMKGWFDFFQVKDKIIKVILFFSFFLLFSGEFMIHNIIFYIIVFYGYDNAKKKGKKYENHAY